jgi:hypothetical protein
VDGPCSGQWWTDNARKALPPDAADAWLGGHFEVVSLGAVKASRSAGIGPETVIMGKRTSR